MKNVKTWEYVVIGVLLLGSSYVVYDLYKKFKSKNSSLLIDDPNDLGVNNLKGESDNIKMLFVSLGIIPIKKTNGAYEVKLVNGKYLVQFYDNNRLILYNKNEEKSTYELKSKGSFSDGGKTIKMDNGKIYNNSSVYKNLYNALEHKF